MEKSTKIPALISCDYFCTLFPHLFSRTSLLRYCKEGMIPCEDTGNGRFVIVFDEFVDVVGDPRRLRSIKMRDIPELNRNNNKYKELLCSWPGSVQVGKKWFVLEENVSKIKELKLGPEGREILKVNRRANTTKDVDEKIKLLDSKIEDLESKMSLLEIQLKSLEQIGSTPAGSSCWGKPQQESFAGDMDI